MGNPCASGTGQPKPGAGAVAFLTNIAVAAFLNRLKLGWLGTVAGVLPQFSFDTDEFCTDGQPDLPTITADDVLALASPLLNINAGPAAIKLRNLILYYLWYELCDCATVDTPAQPAVQDPPDVVSYGDQGASPCLYQPPADLAYDNVSIEGGRLFGPLNWGINATGTTSTFSDASKTARKIKLTMHRTRAITGPHEDPFFAFYRFIDTTTINDTIVVPIEQAGDDYSATITVPTGYNKFEGRLFPNNSSGGGPNENPDDVFHVTVEAFCDQLPGDLVSDCCPTDPRILTAIQQLQADLAAAKLQVDLIQRQAVPFAYVAGEAHFGLTGNGYIDIEGLIGCVIELTTIPEHIGRDFGEVDEIYTESWINWGQLFESSPREKLRGHIQYSFPRAAGLYTRLYYTLEPGVEATIIELEREP